MTVSLPFAVSGSAPDRLLGRAAVLVFLAFALGYFLSAVMRTVIATLSPTLTQEFGLQAADLGLLGGGFFLGFASTQLLLGSWLDRYGPKRVLIGFLAIAVIACLAFSLASNFAGLFAARFLLGVGLSACLMAPLTGFRRWYEPAQMLRAIGIELVREGHPLADGPVLMVANHVSWLDILVLHASGYCRFISKADVRRWPLIGFMAHGAGTLFIARESHRDAHRAVHHMAERLQAGDVLAVFPEGTTGDGLEIKPFHANLLQAAILANAPAQPVALQFIDSATGQISHAPRFIDDDTLLGSVLRTLAARGVQAHVRSAPPEHHRGRDRRQWAQALREQVRSLRER